MQMNADYPIDPAYQPQKLISENYSDWNIVKAVQYGIFSRVIELIEPNDQNIKPYDVNELDEETVTLLHWAAINNRLEIARYLINKHAIVDRKGGNLNATPLHWAIRQSHLVMIHFLLSQGADPYSTDNSGMACIHVAVQTGNVPVIMYLLSYGIDVDSRDANGLTPLMVACMHVRSIEVFRLLINWKANLDATDRDGNTAAHYSVIYANIQAVMQLDKAGINWNCVNSQNKLPYESRNVPWLTERVRQLTINQAEFSNHSKKSDHRFSRLGFRKLHQSSVWRYRVTLSIPPIFMILFLSILNWDLSGFLQSIHNSHSGQQLSFWLTSLCKMILSILLVCISRFLVNRFSDHRSQVVVLFSLAISTTGLLTLVYFVRIIPQVTNHVLAHFSFLLFISLLWFSFIRCVTKNPGYLDTKSAELCQKTIMNLVDEILTQFQQTNSNSSKSSELESRLMNPLGKFCSTCFIRKPLRSKHCRVCDRCVAKFDHHCPWIDNCVGYDNHVWFLIYLLSTSVSCFLFVFGALSYFFNYYQNSVGVDGSSAYYLHDPSPYLHRNPDLQLLIKAKDNNNNNLIYANGSRIDRNSANAAIMANTNNENTNYNYHMLQIIFNMVLSNPTLTICLLNGVFYCFWTSLLFVSQCYQMIFLNATTNERINFDRYISDLTDSKSSSNQQRLSYNRGAWRNLMDLLHLPGYLDGNKKSSLILDWRTVYDFKKIQSADMISL